MSKGLSQLVWPITVLTVAALAAVVVVLLYASVQAAAITGLISTVVLPVILGLLALAKSDAQHAETTEKIDTVSDTLAQRVQNS